MAHRSLGSCGATPNRSVKRCHGELRGREAFIGQSLATPQPKFSAICCHMQMWVCRGGGRAGERKHSGKGRTRQFFRPGCYAERASGDGETSSPPAGEISRAMQGGARQWGDLSGCGGEGSTGREGWGGGLISLLRYDAHATLGGPLWFGGLRGS